jgi:hypothetical protein
MASTITTAGYFDDRASADAAYQGLIASGFSQDSVSLIAPGRDDGGLADEVVTAGDGAKIGGMAGLLLGAAAMLIPGIAPVVAVGPLAAALAGALTGGVSGAVIGGIAAGLLHVCLSQEDAAGYEKRLHQGGFVVTVHTDEASFHNASLVLEHHGADMHGADGNTSELATKQGTADLPIRERVASEQPPTVPAR